VASAVSPSADPIARANAFLDARNSRERESARTSGSFIVAIDASPLAKRIEIRYRASATGPASNCGNSHPREAASSRERAAPAILALPVLSFSRIAILLRPSLPLLLPRPPYPTRLPLVSRCLFVDRVYPSSAIFPYHRRSPCSSLVSACRSDPLFSFSSSAPPSSPSLPPFLPPPRGNAPPKSVDLVSAATPLAFSSREGLYSPPNPSSSCAPRPVRFVQLNFYFFLFLRRQE